MWALHTCFPNNLIWHIFIVLDLEPLQTGERLIYYALFCWTNSSFVEQYSFNFAAYCKMLFSHKQLEGIVYIDHVDLNCYTRFWIQLLRTYIVRSMFANFTYWIYTCSSCFPWIISQSMGTIHKIAYLIKK